MAAHITKHCCRFFLFQSSSKYRSLIHTSVVNNKNEKDELPQTNITRLKPALYRRLKGLPPVWSLPKDPNYGPALNYAKVESEKLKDKYRLERKAYAKFGREVIDINISSLWPSAKEIERDNAKLEFFKPVAERIKDMHAAKEAERLEIEAHQKKISENMAKMDSYLEQYEKRKKKRVEKDTEQLKRREELLEEAREFFGYSVDKNDIKFRQMVEWKEQQEKVAKKRLKRDKQKNILATQVAQLSAELVSPKE